MISISIFSCQGIITNMVLCFPCIIISAGMGGLLGCFTQTLAPLASISLMDPNWPSLLTGSKMGDILFHALPITRGRISNLAIPSCFLELPLLISSEEPTCQCRRRGFDPWVRKVLWRRKWQPTLIFLPGESHGQRSRAGYRTWSCKELDTT